FDPLQCLTCLFAATSDSGHGRLKTLHCVDPCEGRFNGVPDHVEHVCTNGHKAQGGADFLNAYCPRSSCARASSQPSVCIRYPASDLPVVKLDLNDYFAVGHRLTTFPGLPLLIAGGTFWRASQAPYQRPSARSLH